MGANVLREPQSAMGQGLRMSRCGRLLRRRRIGRSANGLGVRLGAIRASVLAGVDGGMGCDGARGPAGGAEDGGDGWMGARMMGEGSRGRVRMNRRGVGQRCALFAAVLLHTAGRGSGLWVKVHPRGLWGAKGNLHFGA